MATILRSRACARAVPSCCAPRRFLKTEAVPRKPAAERKMPPSFYPNDDGGEGEKPEVPRWKETPKAMKAAMQMDFAKKASNKVWTVNNDPARLDAMYEKLLGPGGSKLLPEELKWLAVTHKSFDQGRRGFNDRLALVGRMALQLEATKGVMSRIYKAQQREPDEFDREPVEHEQLAPVENLSSYNPRDLIDKKKMSVLASSVGLTQVVRWKPRRPDSLDTSGLDVVLTGALMAIVGAVSLQHGGALAGEIMRDRILARTAKFTHK